MDEKPHKYIKVHKFLKSHPMGVLSTVNKSGAPWGAAIYYLADDDFTIYFVTRAETDKYENIEHNAHVALTVADPDTQITVQLTGTVSRLPVHKYMEVFFDKFAAIKPENDYKWAPPIDRIHAGNYMPLQIKPNKLQYADYGKHRAGVTVDYIEHIIPSK